MLFYLLPSWRLAITIKNVFAYPSSLPKSIDSSLLSFSKRPSILFLSSREASMKAFSKFDTGVSFIFRYCVFHMQMIFLSNEYKKCGHAFNLVCLHLDQIPGERFRDKYLLMMVLVTASIKLEAWYVLHYFHYRNVLGRNMNSVTILMYNYASSLFQSIVCHSFHSFIIIHSFLREISHPKRSVEYYFATSKANLYGLFAHEARINE